MTALAVTQDQTWWDDKQIAVLRSIGLERATKEDLAMFLSYAQRTGLDPFSRQLYMISRGGRWTIQASIDGLRIVAQRSNEYAGQTPPMWCGPDGQWVDVWLSDKPPFAAKVGVYRVGFVEPLIAVARLDSYCPRKADGSPMGLWGQMPDVMLAKVAEALALRKAFPNDLSGIYTADEMDQADGSKQSKPKAQPTAPVEIVKAELVEATEEVLARVDAAMEQAVRAVEANPMDVEALRTIWTDYTDVLDVPVGEAVAVKFAAGYSDMRITSESTLRDFISSAVTPKDEVA